MNKILPQEPPTFLPPPVYLLSSPWDLSKSEMCVHCYLNSFNGSTVALSQESPNFPCKERADTLGFVSHGVCCNSSPLLLRIESSCTWYIMNELGRTLIKLDLQKQVVDSIEFTGCRRPAWLWASASKLLGMAYSRLFMTWLCLALSPDTPTSHFTHRQCHTSSTPSHVLCTVKYLWLCTRCSTLLEPPSSPICPWNINPSKLSDQHLPHGSSPSLLQGVTAPSPCHLCTCFHYFT